MVCQRAGRQAHTKERIKIESETEESQQRNDFKRNITAFCNVMCMYIKNSERERESEAERKKSEYGKKEYPRSDIY
jgi:hypothetical protein